MVWGENKLMHSIDRKVCTVSHSYATILMTSKT